MSSSLIPPLRPRPDRRRPFLPAARGRKIRRPQGTYRAVMSSSPGGRPCPARSGPSGRIGSRRGRSPRLPTPLEGMRTRCAQRTFLASMALVLCLTATARGEKPYTFTRIADNSGSFTFFNFAPAINEDGTVAFQADETPTPDNGLPQGVFTGRGGPVMTVADSLTGPFGFFTSPASINDAGEVAFAATQPDGSSPAIFISTKNGNLMIIVASGSGPADFFRFFFPSINRERAGGVHGLSEQRSRGELQELRRGRDDHRRFEHGPWSLRELGHQRVRDGLRTDQRSHDLGSLRRQGRAGIDPDQQRGDSAGDFGTFSAGRDPLLRRRSSAINDGGHDRLRSLLRPARRLRDLPRG